MAMAWLWTGMVTVSLIFGLMSGSAGLLGSAALEGAAAAVELCVSMAGVMALWTGVMEVMEQCGLSAALARLLGKGMSGSTALSPVPAEPAAGSTHESSRSLKG